MDAFAELPRLAEELTLGCRILADQEIIDAFGHLSVRYPGRDDCFVINRGMSPSLAEASDFIVCDFEGKVLAGKGHPNGEWPIHAAILKARVDVACVLHSHSRLSRIFSLSPHKLRGLLTSSSPEWQGGLPLYRAAGLVTSLEKGAALANVLGEESAALLRGHGAVVVGRSVRATVMKAIVLKQNADVLHGVLSMGAEPELWADDDLSAWRNPPRATVSDEAIEAKKDKAWDYYVARATGRLDQRSGGGVDLNLCPHCGGATRGSIACD